MTLGTLPEKYRPSRAVNLFSIVWNGSSYVNAKLEISTSGVVKMTQPNGSAISGLQPSFVQNRPFIYMIGA